MKLFKTSCLLLCVMPVQSLAAIIVNQPTTQKLESTTVRFQYASNTGEFCWDAQVNVRSTSGDLLYQSGLLTPSNNNGNQVIHNATGLPDNGQNLLVEMRCTPSETSTRSYESFGSSSDGGTNGNGTDGTEEINVIVELDSTQLTSALGELFTDFNPALFSQILNGMFFAMTIGLGGGWLYKAIKSR